MLFIFLSTNRLGNHPLKVEIRVRIPMGRQFRAVGELVDPPGLGPGACNGHVSSSLTISTNRKHLEYDALAFSERSW